MCRSRATLARLASDTCSVREQHLLFSATLHVTQYYITYYVIGDYYPSVSANVDGYVYQVALGKRNVSLWKKIF